MQRSCCEYGFTALMGASHEGHPEVIRILINEANVDVEAKNIVLPAGVPFKCANLLTKQNGSPAWP